MRVDVAPRRYMPSDKSSIRPMRRCVFTLMRCRAARRDKKIACVYAVPSRSRRYIRTQTDVEASCLPAAACYILLQRFFARSGSTILYRLPIFAIRQRYRAVPRAFFGYRSTVNVRTVRETGNFSPMPLHSVAAHVIRRLRYVRWYYRHHRTRSQKRWFSRARQAVAAPRSCCGR